MNTTAPINFHNIAIMGGLGPNSNGGGVLGGGRGPPGTAVGGSRGTSGG